MDREGRGDVKQPDQNDPMFHDFFPRLRKGTIASLLDRQVDDHRTRFHLPEHLLRDQDRGPLARDQRRCNNEIGLFRILADQLLFFFVKLRWKLLGVAAGIFGLVVGNVQRDEFPSEALDLFAYGRAGVERRYDASQAFGRRDRLESGHSGPDDYDLGRRNGSRGGAQHRQKTSARVRSDEDRFVAGDGAHRREGIHPLGAGNPGNHFHRERRDAPLGQPLDQLRVAEGLKEADEEDPLLNLAGLLQGRTVDLQEDVRLRKNLRGRGDRGARGFKLLIFDERAFSGTGLYDDLHAAFDDFADGLRDGGDPSLAGEVFFWNSDSHVVLRS